MDENTSSVGALVREQEQVFLHSTTQVSKYVQYSMHNTIERIYAYMNDTFISGQEDSLGRKKPFFNIVKSAVNVWFHATDLDRKDIKIIATKTSDWIDAFLATVVLRDWMRKDFFGQFLNEWGMNDARFGGSIIKFVENKSGLHVSVVPWSRIICDAVDFDSNPQIEVLELTQSELRKRVKTMGYDEKAVEGLIASMQDRMTLDRIPKDQKANYIRVYEVHGSLKKSLLTHDKKDSDTYVQQMHVISFVGGETKDGKKEYKDYTLYAGVEDMSPYYRTYLLSMPDRTLPIGAIENLFEVQREVNHSMKTVRDTMDLSSKIVLQTPDNQYLNMNALDAIETGDILTYAASKGPLARVPMEAPQMVAEFSYASQWKQIGNEINTISDAMLGVMPHSGTAWRLQQMMLNENYSMFELMSENKAMHLERMLRERIIPYILKKKLNNADEISAILSDYEIDQIDQRYMKREAVKRYNDKALKDLFDNAKAFAQGKETSPIAPFNPAGEMEAIKQETEALGNQRFFKPGDLSTDTWRKQLKDLPWEVVCDITGESYDTKAIFDVLNMSLKMMMTPGFDQNPKAQAVVKRMFELSGAFSPIEYDALPQAAPQPPTGPAIAAQPLPRSNAPAAQLPPQNPAVSSPPPQQVAAQ